MFTRLRIQMVDSACNYALRGVIIALVLFSAWVVPVSSSIAAPPAQTRTVQPSIKRLSTEDITTVQAMLNRLELYFAVRTKAGNQSLLTFDELYQQLNPEEARIVRFVHRLKPKQLGLRTPWMGYGDPATPMTALKESYPGSDGVMLDIPTQHMPTVVHDHYQAMMAAMQADLGRRLYVSSAHRSGAYQLYQFFYYLKSHNWSIQETGRFVALPGYSEHGAKHRQALDFVSRGVALEDETEKFEHLPEYDWLQKHARRFGFVLSYPRNSATGITFEPWHWHFDPRLVSSR